MIETELHARLVGLVRTLRRLNLVGHDELPIYDVRDFITRATSRFLDGKN